MTSEHDKNFFAAIDDSSQSLVETWQATVAQLAQAAQEETTLSSYIHSLLQQHAFMLQQADNDQHLIFGTYSTTKETKTLLLFSSCPPQQNALARWGSFVTRLLTFALYHKAIGSIPLNIVWLIDIEEHSEDDEESIPWLANNQIALQIDSCFYDMPYEASLPTPCLALGMKGLLRVEIGVETAHEDHQVLYDAILPDAAWRLTWALNSLKDAREEIHIEGFYETLVPLEDEEIALLRGMLDGEQALKQHLNVHEFLLQLYGFQLYYTHLLLPTCTITSIDSGHTSAAALMLPSSAKASLTIHLVPDQEPKDIYKKLRQHLDVQGFQDVYIKVLAMRSPRHTLLRNEFVKTVYESARALYGEKLQTFPLMPSWAYYYPLRLSIPVIYAQTGYVEEQLYAHDTVTRAASEERQKQFLVHGIKHLAMIIERTALATDTTR